MRGQAIRWALVAALALLFVACGGDGDPAGNTRSRATGAAATSPTPDSSPEAPRPPTVVLDPGHGGSEVGAADHGVVEKESNLDMALRVEEALQAAGVRVVLTRRDDTRVAENPSASSGFAATRFDLQRRIDIANEEQADLFISIHSNGSRDASQNGVEVWYDPNRQFGAQNGTFAQTVLDRVLSELNEYGYVAGNRGIKDDTCFRARVGRCFTLFVLGPERTTTREEIIRRGAKPEALGLAPGENALTTRATNMPGVLVELLFISNAADAAVLRDEAGRDAIAHGIAEAALHMLGETAG